MIDPFWRNCALGLCLVLLARPAASQTPGVRLLEDARDGRLDDTPFFTAALIASGVEETAELHRWLNVYAASRSEIASIARSLPVHQRPSALQSIVGERILVGDYETTATDMRLTLLHGDFNCLSATALAFDLCQAAGCSVQIRLTRGHVYLLADDENSSIHRVGGGARRLTPVELLAKFYYNRGIVQLRQRNFANGIRLLETSLELDPHDGDARANIAAGLNNWAAEHLRAKRLAEAAALIQRGRRLDPALAPLIANERLLRSELDN